MLQYLQKFGLFNGVETCLHVDFDEIQFRPEFIDQYKDSGRGEKKAYNLPSRLRGNDSLNAFNPAYTWSGPKTDAPKRCGRIVYHVMSALW